LFAYQQLENVTLERILNIMKNKSETDKFRNV